MKIVVDTNVIFSALLNSNSIIADLLFNSEKHFEFFSCEYMIYEIEKHWERLKKISKLSDEQIEISYSKVISNLVFINEELITQEIWLASEQLVKGIDIDDIDFVALTIFLEATLWTGDKVLYKGLKRLDFKRLMNTGELLTMRDH